MKEAKGHGCAGCDNSGSHAHASKLPGTAFAIGIALNTAFVIVEGFSSLLGIRLRCWRTRLTISVDVSASHFRMNLPDASPRTLDQEQTPMRVRQSKPSGWCTALACAAALAGA